MPKYDVRCPNGHDAEIFTKWDDREAPCPTCGAPTERMWMTSFPNIIGDEIDYIDHNLGPTPIRIRSKSERRRLMKERGLIERIQHVGAPGSDKSPVTKPWW